MPPQADDFRRNSAMSTVDTAVPTPRHPSGTHPSATLQETPVEDGGLTWHDVEASVVWDAVSGREVLALVQTDVTATVNSDLAMKKVRTCTG